MSSNNHVEIKRKQALQAQFQLATSQTQSKIASWLQPSSKSPAQPSNDTTTLDSFLSLPVIKNGGGLNLDQGKIDTTIGDFIKSDVDMKKLKSTETQPYKVNKPRGNESRALAALQNRLRNQNREKIRKENDTVSVTKSSHKTAQIQTHDSDSDEDGDARKITSKKSSTPLFGAKSKGKKSKGRPF